MTQAPKEHIDIIALINAGTHFAEKHGDKIHVIDCKTGETFIMYGENTPKVPTQLELVVLADGTKVWTQEALAPSTTHIRETTFNPVIIDLMCQKILENQGLTEICGTLGFPTYTTFCRWRREHPWIDEHIDRARKDRAELYRDKVRKTADESYSTKDPIAASALKIESYKWLAGVDAPERYSPKAKFEATINAPTQIIVDTGIVREPRVVVPLPIEDKKE